MTNRRAAFLDRDGTIIEDEGYVRSPDQVQLRPGAAEAIARLRAASFTVIVVTNQSGIARGLFGWPEYRAVAARLDALLQAAGTSLDATYVCPHHPDYTGACQCRKPALQLYREAEAEWNLDLRGSVWIGDQARDVEPALALGGRGFLIDPGRTAVVPGVAMVPSLAEAVGAVVPSR